MWHQLYIAAQSLGCNGVRHCMALQRVHLLTCYPVLGEEAESSDVHPLYKHLFRQRGTHSERKLKKNIFHMTKMSAALRLCIHTYLVKYYDLVGTSEGKQRGRTEDSVWDGRGLRAASCWSWGVKLWWLHTSGLKLHSHVWVCSCLTHAQWQEWCLYMHTRVGACLTWSPDFDFFLDFLSPQLLNLLMFQFQIKPQIWCHFFPPKHRVLCLSQSSIYSPQRRHCPTASCGNRKGYKRKKNLHFFFLLCLISHS